MSNEGDRNIQLFAQELSAFLERSEKGLPPDQRLSPEQSVTDLQLGICRTLREHLPGNKALLVQAHQRQWVPILLSWLNLHDRPALQMEALLVLTYLAELCAQKSYLHQKTWNDAVEAANKLAANSKYHPFAPSPGSVPFPPLSFSQTLSTEALSAFDTSLTFAIQNSADYEVALPASWTLPPAPLFPSGAGSAINFTSLAPPPGGAHTAVPSNAFLPPPSPVAASSSVYPQRLSASAQHLLLRHADAIPTLISLLSSNDKQVYEQSLWILGSIAAGDSPGAAATADSKAVSARDVILAAGVMNQLLRCLETHTSNLSLQRIGAWTLSNLVDGIFQQNSKNSNNNNNNGNNIGASNNSGGKTSDYSSSDEIETATLLPVLKRLLHMSDSEVLSYTCWTLSHLCDGPSSHIAAVVTSAKEAPPGGLVPRLVELLGHASWRVTKPALRTIGNIVCAECGEDVSTDYTEVILQCHAVPKLKELVSHNNREIQKEACWTLSNIAAGTVDQIQAVIDSGAISPLVKLVQDKKTDQEVRSEACWVVLNATSCGSDSQIELLVDEGCVAVLGVLLSEASMVMMALEGLERVLQVEETRELIRREQIENGEIDDDDDEETRTPILVSAALIEKARDSLNTTAVIKRADRIWKQHFVSCALCKKSFSKHRTSDASFCEECKCHVCCNCNCRIYHLDYQEELWAETEEKSEAKKNARKSKNKKKKEKLKQKKAKQQQEEQVQVEPVTQENPKKEEEEDEEEEEEEPIQSTTRDEYQSSSLHETEEYQTSDSRQEFHKTFDDDNDENQIDFVLYLQQTGSIIALAKLMDALEYDEEELDDYERKMIREQKLLKSS